VAQARLESELESRLGGLKGVLGGAAETGPEELLAEADALWEAGSKAEARPLYKRLMDDHKYSLAYQLNKDRIKQRARAKLD